MVDNLKYELAVEQRFKSLWNRLGCKGDYRRQFNMLAIAYRGYRKYHTLAHVYWGLVRIKEIAIDEDYSYIEPIEWAMFYHDYVMHFDGITNDDEELSAFIAAKSAQDAGLTPQFCQDVGRLVMKTAHIDPPEYIDEAILVDSDIAILGGRREAFDQYETQVREEWSHVSDEDFRVGRIVVLNRFKNMDRIFHTKTGYDRFEKQARENIEYSLHKLNA